MAEGGESLPVGQLWGCPWNLRGWLPNAEQPDTMDPWPSHCIVGCHGCCSSRGAHNKIGEDEERQCRRPDGHFGSRYAARQQKRALQVRCLPSPRNIAAVLQHTPPRDPGQGKEVVFGLAGKLQQNEVEIPAGRKMSTVPTAACAPCRFCAAFGDGWG